MRLGTYEEIPRLKRFCLKHRLMLIPVSLEEQDSLISGIGGAEQPRRDVLLKAVWCRRCRSRNGMAALPRPQR